VEMLREVLLWGRVIDAILSLREFAGRNSPRPATPLPQRDSSPPLVSLRPGTPDTTSVLLVTACSAVAATGRRTTTLPDACRLPEM
jgi:hypothetical protein